MVKTLRKYKGFDIYIGDTGYGKKHEYYFNAYTKKYDIGMEGSFDKKRYALALAKKKIDDFLDEKRFV